MKKKTRKTILIVVGIAVLLLALFFLFGGKELAFSRLRTQSESGGCSIDWSAGECKGTCSSGKTCKQGGMGNVCGCF